MANVEIIFLNYKYYAKLSMIVSIQFLKDEKEWILSGDG